MCDVACDLIAKLLAGNNGDFLAHPLVGVEVIDGHLIGRRHYPVHIVFFCASSVHSIYTQSHCCTAQEYLKRLNQSKAVEQTEVF